MGREFRLHKQSGTERKYLFLHRRAGTYPYEELELLSKVVKLRVLSEELENCLLFEKVEFRLLSKEVELVSYTKKSNSSSVRRSRTHLL